MIGDKNHGEIDARKKKVIYLYNIKNIFPKLKIHIIILKL
jgi:hypothetical protein